MFDRMFKRKDNAPYTELARKSRVEKRVPRPKTAPPAIGSPPPAHQWDACRDSRRSFQEGVVNRGYGVAQTSAWRSTSPTVDDATIRNAENLSRPVMDRSSSSTSCNIRNPFRSCNDSFQTLAMSRSPTRESSAEGVPVERAVRTFRAMHHEGYTNFVPQKAAIFTTNRIVSQYSDPFADENADDTASPTTPTTRPANSSADVRPSVTGRPRRHHWSFLRSSRGSPQDLLKVTIPSGAFSPPTREHRHSFWSRT